jgi:predicted DsbA family dithiol-disulfide isomerase
MSEFLAFEYTDVHSLEAWIAEPVLRHVRRRYEHVAWWRSVHVGAAPAATTPAREHARWVRSGATGLAPRLEYLPASPEWGARAAHAAAHQGRARAEAVLRRLREATFVHGRPVDDVDRIREAVAGIPGLDVWRLIRDLDSPDVVWSVETDRAMARRHGFSAPTLLLRGPRGDRVVAGRQPAEAYVAAIEAVAPGVAPADLEEAA